jgi:hypothetical protein
MLFYVGCFLDKKQSIILRISSDLWPLRGNCSGGMWILIYFLIAWLNLCSISMFILLEFIV